MDRKKLGVYILMAIGAIVGGIGGAVTAGELPGELKKFKELAEKGEVSEPKVDE